MTLRGKHTNHTTRKRHKMEKELTIDEMIDNVTHEDAEVRIQDFVNDFVETQETDDGLSFELSKLDQTELGLSDRFDRRFGEVAKFVRNGAWTAFDGVRWRRKAGGEVKEMSKKLVRLLKNEARFKSDEVMKGKKLSPREGYYRFFNAMSSEGRMKAATSLSSSSLMIDEADFNKDAHLLNTFTGVVNLTNGDLYAHDPKFMITGVTKAGYNKHAKRDKWERFITDICSSKEGVRNKDREHFLKIALGEGLFAHNDARHIFFITGDEHNKETNGSNGKSTLFYILRSVLGPEYLKTFKKGMICKVNGKSPDIEDRAQLLDARIAYCAELSEDDIVDAEAVKNITGEKHVLIRNLYENETEIAQTATIFVTTNSMGRYLRPDHALWERMRRIVMENFFYDEKKGNPGYGKPLVKGFAEEIIAEEAEGVLAWLVEASVEYAQKGLPEFAESYNSFEDVKKKSDPIADFFDDCIVRDDNKKISAKNIYDAYVAYCFANSSEAVNQNKFGYELNKRGVEVVKTGGVKFRSGVRFNLAGHAYSEGLDPEKLLDFEAREINTGNTKKGTEMNPQELALFPSSFRKHSPGQIYNGWQVLSEGVEMAIEEEAPHVTSAKRSGTVKRF